MFGLKKWLATLLTAGGAVLAFAISLGVMFFALPVLLLFAAVGLLRMQQYRSRRPVIIDHIRRG